MEEPRKLFKTISLEERLAGSIYDIDPAKGANSKKEGVALKANPNIPEKNAQILKSLSISRNQQESIALKRTKSLLSTQLGISPVRTTFASSISLENRLKQTNITSTQHLPQYFLSDLYTGYLTIKPFRTDATELQNIGDLKTITIGGVIKNQAQSILTTATPSINTILVLQGTVDTVGSFISITPEQKPIGELSILASQGTFLKLGKYLSLTNPTTPKGVVQGTVDITKITVIPNQGPGVTPNNAPSISTIARLQGLVVSDGILRGSALLLAEPLPGITLENSPTPQLAALAVNTSLEDSPTPLLNILGYEADRALAFLAPQIKHGSTTVGVFETDPNRNPPKDTTTPVVGPAQPDPNRNPPKEFTSPAIAEDIPSSLLGLDDLNQIESAVETSVDFPGSNQGSLSTYNALSYGQLKRKERETSGGNGLGAKAIERGSVQQIGVGRSARQNVQDQPGNDFKDFIDLVIQGGGKTVKLKSYLASFSDSFTAEWNSSKYVGRQDTFYNFTGASRAVSFAVKVPAFSAVDLKPNFDKINRIIGMTQVGNFSNNSTYLEGPLCQLTLGNLFVKTYCIFNSVKIDFDPTETPFDIDEKLPQLVTISFDAAILASNNNELLNSSTNTYYGNSSNNLGLTVG